MNQTTTRSLGTGAPRETWDDGEKLTIAELRELQLTRLRETLQRAYDNVPHYTKKFDELGVTPADLKTLADLAKFPFTDKTDLRDNYPFGMFAVPREQVNRIHASSGTTGQPTVVGYTSNDLDTWATLIGRCLRAAGGKPGNMVHNAYGYGLFTGGLGVHSGAEKSGYSVVPISGGMTPRQVQLIQDFQPEIITCTPTYLLTIIDEFKRQGLDATQSSLTTAICGAEPWTEAMRQELEAKLGVHAVDIYGLSELMGPGVAMECVETKDGLHIWEDHFYPETIDPFTGEVLPDGAEGELVFTSLSKEALPIIRYRTHDLASLLPGTARPTFRRMSRITGRSDDLLIIRGVNVFPTQVEEVLLSVPSLSPHFKLILTRPDRMDELEIKVEAREDSGEDTWGDAMRTANGLIKERIGITCRITVVPAGSLERSVGKLKRIQDNRENVR